MPIGSSCQPATRPLAISPGLKRCPGWPALFSSSGAKSLLVSHWPVYSDAATLLTTKAFKYIEDGQNAGQPVGRAQALRLAMLSLIENSNNELGFTSVLLGSLCGGWGKGRWLNNPYEQLSPRRRASLQMALGTGPQADVLMV